MIWSTVEGFAGPYGPGSDPTDIGPSIMYAFIFVAIIIIERSSNYNKNSLDALIERKLMVGNISLNFMMKIRVF